MTQNAETQQKETYTKLKQRWFDTFKLPEAQKTLNQGFLCYLENELTNDENHRAEVIYIWKQITGCLQCIENEIDPGSDIALKIELFDI